METEHKTNIKKNKVTLKLNQELYPLETIYTVSYLYLDEAYFFLKKDDKNRIIIEITPKNKTDIENFAKEFKNQLINYGQQILINKENSDIKKKILEEILFHSVPKEKKIEQGKKSELYDEELEMIDEELEIDDPEGIFVPWEEKYGKNE